MKPQVVVLEDCSFSRVNTYEYSDKPEDTSPCLEKMDCTIIRGELIGVIGSMGSGKSTFIEALAGEQYHIKGSMKVQERVIHVPNGPWLRSGTIRDNILFGSDYVQGSYAKVIRACGLQEDFRRLAFGDQTWVHGDGENLSGGQKQRICLARAVYKGSQLYVMDDPLSAVDPKLRQMIFKEVISHHGLMRKKTRIIALSDYTFLDQMDRVILMHEGTIADIGSPEDLKARHDLSSEVMHHKNSEEIEDKFEDSMRLRPVMKRQDTTQGILKSMKSKDFDNADDMVFESVTLDNYLYYLRSMGFAGILFSLLGYILTQTFDVLSKVWLANWTASEGHENEAREEEEEGNFIIIFGAFGICQAVSFLVGVIQCNKITLTASSKIHNETFHKVVYSHIDFIWSNPVGAIANRFSRDMNELDLVLPNTLKNFLFQVSTMKSFST